MNRTSEDKEVSKVPSRADLVETYISTKHGMWVCSLEYEEMSNFGLAFLLGPW